jgi:arylsulfatase A-like enzyme
MLIRWPSVIKPNTIYNDVFSHYNLIPTFCAAAGEPDIASKCLAGYQAGTKTFKVHLDGCNLSSVRIGDWKVVFKAQEHEGIDVWRREFTNLRAPKLFDLRADPFERGDESMEYEKWFFDRSFVVVPSQAVVAKWLESFEQFPIRQKPASFNLDEVMTKLTPSHLNLKFMA